MVNAEDFVQLPDLLGGPAQRSRSRRAARTEAPPLGVVGYQAAQPCGDFGDTAGRDEDATIGRDDLQRTGCGRRDDRQSSGQRLDDGQPEWLRIDVWLAINVGRRADRREVWLPSEEPHSIVDAECRCQGADFLEVRLLARSLGRTYLPAAPAWNIPKGRERLEMCAMPLVWLPAPDLKDDDIARSRMEPLSKVGAARGCDGDVELDRAIHHPVRYAGHETLEPIGGPPAVGDHHVRPGSTRQTVEMTSVSVTIVCPEHQRQALPANDGREDAEHPYFVTDDNVELATSQEPREGAARRQDRPRSAVADRAQNVNRHAGRAEFIGGLAGKAIRVFLMHFARGAAMDRECALTDLDAPKEVAASDLEHTNRSPRRSPGQVVFRDRLG